MQNYNEKNEAIRAADVSYACKIVHNYLIVGIALHLFSALDLYLLLYYKIMPSGYWGLAFPCCLQACILRATCSVYPLSAQCYFCGYTLHPKQDVPKLIYDVHILKNKVAILCEILQTANPELLAFAKKCPNRTNRTKGLCNGKANLQLANGAENCKTLSEDTKFLSQARDLIRSIKNA